MKARSCFRLALKFLLVSFVSLLAFDCVSSRVAAQTISGKFYEYKVLSMTGQTPLNANVPLTSMFGPSINNNGTVAFGAEFSGGGQGVVAASPTLAQTLISFAGPPPNRMYGPSVQINDAGQVLAQDIYPGAPPAYFDRLWFVDQPGTFTVLIKSGNGQPFASVLANGSVNKNGDAVMPALDQQYNTVIVSVKGGKVVGQLQLPSGSFTFPQIADTGSILVRLGGQPTSPIKLYDQTLTTVQVVIADSTNFRVIGNQPGISADGNVVAFYATPNANSTLGPTPGIFAAVNTGAGWQYVRITGIPAELGFDDNGNPLAFSSYSNDSRVAVVNLGLGAAGLADDSFIISFIGTPSAASCTNPVLGNGIPLLFSNQQGLWTIRVDVQKQLSPPNSQVFHPLTAIPAVQIGDTLGTNVISSISVFNQLANAAQDDSGNVRTMRRGDHRIVFQATTSAGQQLIVRGSHLDSDQDGLLDHWETTGIDVDQDGVIDLDLPAMGANPNRRDLFVQIDWLSDLTGSSKFQPTPGVISPAPGQTVSPLVKMFSQAPALTGNLYGARSDGKAPANIPAGITLHIDGGPGKDTGKPPRPFSINMGAGPLKGGNQITNNGAAVEVLYFGKSNSITAPGVSTLAFKDAKDSYFGQADKDGREFAFHYVIFNDYFNFETDSTGANTWMVASATANTLTSASALPANTQISDVVKITGGKGANQYGVVTMINLATNTLTLQGNWQIIPDATSSFVLLLGNTGLGEVFFFSSPDNNSLPGNDLTVTMGSAGLIGYKTKAGVLGNQCLDWRTLAHELGHTLGLRHGGTDQNAYKGNAYLSLMSYSWTQVCKAAVQSYSGAADPTFNDWANLQGDFPNVEIHLGNSLGLGFGSVPEYGQQVPELTGLDFMNQNGPPNNTPPKVTIQSPPPNSKVYLTKPLTVVVKATDVAGVASVTVSFDVNGDGKIGKGELITAKPTGQNTYTAKFQALSGPAGSRKIKASAIDYLGNYATVSESVNVVQPSK